MVLVVVEVVNTAVVVVVSVVVEVDSVTSSGFGTVAETKKAYCHSNVILKVYGYKSIFFPDFHNEE